MTIFLILFLGCNGQEPTAPVHGCTDPNAVNYDPLSTLDDQSCAYLPFTLEINSTGESHLVIFLDTITGLTPGDYLGIFDANGILFTVDNENDVEYGEVLVAEGVLWDGEANDEGTVAESSAIMSLGLSDFGGPILNGAVNQNPIIIKIYDIETQTIKSTTPIFDMGGEFGDLFSAVSELTIE